jgi:hypothetical protein
MGLWARRRCQRHARALLRPGCVPPDLHAALLAAQEQRRQWQELATGGGWPRVPAGLADADGRHATVAAELSRLEKVLAHTPEGGRLLPAPLDELERRLGRLAGDHDAVEALPRRTAALATLRTLGLEPLVDDLRTRSCPADQVTHELELAWWRSLLQLLLAEDPDLRAADAAAHDEALAALRAADRARQREVARRLRDARAVAGAPACRVTSPMALPQEVPAGTDVDVVVLAGAHRVGAAEGALALGRAAHVVVVGDPQGLPPVAISLEEDAPARPSVLELLDGALPTLPLHRQHRMPEQLRRCTDAVAPVTGERRLPAPPGAADVGFDFVPDGVGHPGPDGAIESVDAEIDRVVALVLEHVRQRPEESLAVIALSRPHARRVADALRDELPDQPDVARWLARGRAEPFVVTDAERAEDAVRDAAIVTLGFGRTPHGRVLHRFGRLDDEGGERRLLVALTRPRRRLRVVSCLQADDLDVERLRTPGARALHALLRCLGDGVPVAAEAGVPATERDPLLQDLARRLTDRGRSPLDGPGHGPHLVVPDREGRGAVAVLTDLDPLEDPHDLHERDLLLPDQLTRFGWRVVRLGAVGMFTDPDAQVRRVLRAAR